MTFQTWENPMGTDGFEFIEYAAPDPKALGELFVTMGFTAIAKHRTKDVTLFRQGGVNFIINAEPDSFAQKFARKHGQSVCALRFPRQGMPMPPTSAHWNWVPGVSTIKPALWN